MRPIYLLNLLFVLALLLITASPSRAVGTRDILKGIDTTKPYLVRQSAAKVQSPGTGNWQIECVDCPKQFGAITDRSLRLDDAGHPHVAYGGDHLYYAWHDGSRWHYDTVDDSKNVGWYASLALDGAGWSHISYYEGYPHFSLKHAWRDEAGWHIETVDNEGDVGGFTSLALDRAGRIHISYYDFDNNHLKYAQFDGIEWHIEIVDIEGGPTSLALDRMDHPHISYISGYLKYAWYDGAEWHVEIVDSGTPMGWDSSLALDGADHPHVSYNYCGQWPIDCYETELKYAWHDGTTWHIETVDSEGGEGHRTSLALDGSGQPHIIYSGRDIKYAWHNGMEWHVETIDTGWYGAASLALDEIGRPNIFYYDSMPDYHLKYAQHDGKDWQIEIVDSEGEVGGYTSLVLDGTGHPHISYHDGLRSALKYAWDDGTTWHTETVDDEGSVGQFTSLALDEADYPHISYSDFSNDNLKYAWYDGTIWHTEIVDDEGYSGWHTSLALDKMGHPHISYESIFPIGLKYAWHDGTTWHIKIVDDEGDIRGPTSLALDEMDYPHISYLDLNNSALKYAWYDGATWNIETVELEAMNSSLALDRAGHPHIGYNYCVQWLPPDCFEINLRYTWRDEAGWHTETVDSIGDLSWGISLALDGMDYPHISYLGNRTLKYAWHDGMSWHIETVDSKRNAGVDSSLALDEAGLPHISYLDYADEDLKYAYWLPSSLALDKLATPSDGLCSNETLTYQLTISGPGLGVRLWDPLPPVVHYVPGSLTSSLTPTAIYSSTAHAVLWQGMLPTNTLQTVRFQVTPDITTARALSSSLPITNTAWLTNTKNGTTTSATTSVNLMPISFSLKKRATPSDGVRNGEILTYTLTLSGSGLNVRLWDSLPNTLHYIPGSLTSTTALTAVYTPTARAITWQGRLPTDTVQVIQFQVTPGVTGTGSLSLLLPVVNTAWLINTENGASVSATVIVNGRHVYLPLIVRKR